MAARLCNTLILTANVVAANTCLDFFCFNFNSSWGQSISSNRSKCCEMLSCSRFRFQSRDQDCTHT